MWTVEVAATGMV
jgi:hypothetical protein